MKIIERISIFIMLAAVCGCGLLWMKYASNHSEYKSLLKKAKKNSEKVAGQEVMRFPENYATGRAPETALLGPGEDAKPENFATIYLDGIAFYYPYSVEKFAENFETKREENVSLRSKAAIDVEEEEWGDRTFLLKDGVPFFVIEEKNGKICYLGTVGSLLFGNTRYLYSSQISSDLNEKGHSFVLTYPQVVLAGREISPNDECPLGESMILDTRMRYNDTTKKFEYPETENNDYCEVLELKGSLKGIYISPIWY